MTTLEKNQECENQSEEPNKIKQCLNFQHCRGFVGCAKDIFDKPISGYKTKEDLCFNCNHWEELYENQNKDDFIDIIFIRVNGRHYQCSIKDINKPPTKYAGFGGRKFDVVMKNFHQGADFKFYTCDMWTQGTIPEHYREKLPDNAEFVNEVYEVVHEDGTRSFGIKKFVD